MSDLLNASGHKRPLSPLQSREAVRQASKDKTEWTTIDEDLIMSEPYKRQKSNHQGFPSLNLGSSLLRMPAREAAAKAAISRATDEEFTNSFEENPPCKSNGAAIPQYIPRSAYPYQKYLSSPEDEIYATGRQIDGKVNQADRYEENADQEAARLAQLANTLPEDTEMADCTMTTTPESDFIKQLKAQREREGLQRSRLNRAANLESRTRSKTISNSGSSMTSILSNQNNLTHRQIVCPPRNNPGALREIGTLPSLNTPAEEAENERILDYVQAQAHGKVYNEDSTRNDAVNNTVSTGIMPHINPYSHSTVASAHRLHEQRIVQNEAGRQRLLQLQEMRSMQEGKLPGAKFIIGPLQSRSLNMHQLNMSSFQNIASNADNWKLSASELSAPPIQALGSTQPTAPPTQALENFEVNLYPRQGENLDLPKDFEQKTEYMQKIIIQHEICKSRIRNLDVIPELIRWITTAGSAKPFTLVEQRELREAKTYLSKVLEEELCGSKRRIRIAAIRDNMKRRANNLPSPPQEDIDMFYHSLFSPRLQDKLSIEKAKLEEQTQNLGDLRKLNKNSKKRINLSQNASSTKAEANLTGDATLDLSEPEARSKIRSKRSAKKQTKRPSQFRTIEEKEVLLKARLEAFDTHQDGGTNNSGESIDDSVRDDDGDAMSEISEENGGINYYHGTRIVEEGNANVTSTLEHSQAHEGRKSQAVTDQSISSSQQPHEGLRKELEGKQNAQKHRAQPRAQRPDIDLLNRAKEKAAVGRSATDDDKAEPEALCDDSDVSEAEQSNDEDRICYRYQIYICATGIDGFDNATPYLQFTYLNSGKANDQAGVLVKEIMAHHMPHTDDATEKSWKRSEEHRDGLVEYNLALGRDEEVVARVWVEQEEFSVSNQAFKDARFKRACLPKPVYFVMWERTVCRWVDDPEVQEDDVTAVDNDEAIAEEIVTESEVSAQEKSAKEASSMENVASSDTVPASDSHKESFTMGESKDDDDLFGPLSPEPADDAMEVSSDISPDDEQDSTSDDSVISVAQDNIVSVERPSPTDMAITTSIALANRLAKDRFLVWLTGQVRGREHHAYIRHEEGIMEAEIERCGNKTTWSKVEVFEGEFEDGTKGSEELKVWVQEKQVIGPAN